MADRPILFSAPMIQALLDGRKTQTRRLLKTKITTRGGPSIFDGSWADSYVLDPGNQSWRESGYQWRTGDGLWVREAHYMTDDGDSEFAIFAADEEDVAAHLEQTASLKASHPTANWARHEKLRPSIHLPRWASRLTLIVTDVRVQRLQDISEEDAKAEGVDPETSPLGRPGWFGAAGIKASSAKGAYRHLWDSINGPGAWAANPWVSAITFTVHHANIDALLAAAPICEAVG